MGHSIKFCPKSPPQPTANPQDELEGICYKCGETSHTSSTCKTKTKTKPDGAGEHVYPFAKCFLCGVKGHLTATCPSNERGMYPNGGGCKLCGSVKHLARECPTLKKNKSGREEVVLGLMDGLQGGDDDDVFLALEEEKKKSVGEKRAAPVASVTKKKAKTVVF
jgi:zinc finger CCHC domain-containing protein 9